MYVLDSSSGCWNLNADIEEQKASIKGDFHRDLYTSSGSLEDSINTCTGHRCTTIPFLTCLKQASVVALSTSQTVEPRACLVLV